MTVHSRALPVNVVPVPSVGSTVDDAAREKHLREVTAAHLATFLASQGAPSSTTMTAREEEEFEALFAQQAARTTAGSQLPPGERTSLGFGTQDFDQLLVNLETTTAAGPHLPQGARQSLTADALRGYDVRSLRGGLRPLTSTPAAATTTTTTSSVVQSPALATNSGGSLWDMTAEPFIPAMTTTVIPRDASRNNGSGSPARGTVAAATQQASPARPAASPNGQQQTGSGKKKKKGGSGGNRK